MAGTAAPSQWHLLRDISVSYAHCFMFVSPTIREPLCTVLLLALELEKALVSEEVMIRLIRIQWWDDAISAGTSHHAHPLIRQIITLKEQGILTAESLDGLCESWRSAAEDRDCLAAAWQTSIACLASIIGASKIGASNMSGSNDEIARIPMMTRYSSSSFAGTYCCAHLHKALLKHAKNPENPSQYGQALQAMSH
jgi:hypothetical protein